jgi:protein required for attachment to host cells
MPTFVLVADGSRARFFVRQPDRSLTEADVRVSPEHRLKEGDLTSDRPGRSYDSRGGGRHAMEQGMSKRERAAIAFAKRLAEELDAQRRVGELERLVLIAAPRFLGHLRSALSAETTALVALAIDKDLSQAPAEDIARQLPRFF